MERKMKKPYKESAKQVKEEIKFMKAKGAPKKMVEHEMREAKAMKGKK